MKKNSLKIAQQLFLSVSLKWTSQDTNSLAVVPIERDACGGCFSQVPLQRQLDVRLHLKIIACENCGRVLVDSGLAEEIREKMEIRV